MAGELWDALADEDRLSLHVWLESAATDGEPVIIPRGGVATGRRDTRGVANRFREVGFGSEAPLAAKGGGVEGAAAADKLLKQFEVAMRTRAPG